MSTVFYSSGTLKVNGTTIKKRSDQLFNLSVGGVVPERLRVTNDGSTYTDLIHKYIRYEYTRSFNLHFLLTVNNYRHGGSSSQYDNRFDSLTIELVPNAYSRTGTDGTWSNLYWMTNQTIYFRLYEPGTGATKDLGSISAQDWSTFSTSPKLSFDSSYVSSGWPNQGVYIQAKFANSAKPFRVKGTWSYSTSGELIGSWSGIRGSTGEEIDESEYKNLYYLPGWGGETGNIKAYLTQSSAAYLSTITAKRTDSVY